MDPELSKIRWRCHRGMLELDLYLQHFFDNNYLELPEREQRCFVELLQEQDPDLFAWIMGHQPVKPEFEDIILKIQKSYDATGH